MHRLVLRGIATQTEIETSYSLDDVDSWNLLLDELDAATAQPKSE